MASEGGCWDEEVNEAIKQNQRKYVLWLNEELKIRKRNYQKNKRLV